MSNSKIDLIEATKQAILNEGDEERKVTPMAQKILDAVAEYNIPDEFTLKLIDDFREKSKRNYFGKFKIQIPKFVLEVAPNMVDYSMSSLLNNPQVVKAYWDRLRDEVKASYENQD